MSTFFLIDTNSLFAFSRTLGAFDLKKRKQREKNRSSAAVANSTVGNALAVGSGAAFLKEVAPNRLAKNIKLSTVGRAGLATGALYGFYKGLLNNRKKKRKLFK